MVGAFAEVRLGGPEVEEVVLLGAGEIVPGDPRTFGVIAQVRF